MSRFACSHVHPFSPSLTLIYGGLVRLSYIKHLTIISNIIVTIQSVYSITNTRTIHPYACARTLGLAYPRQYNSLETHYADDKLRVITDIKLILGSMYAQTLLPVINNINIVFTLIVIVEEM